MSVVNDLSSFATSIIRLGRGVYPRTKSSQRPALQHPLELYDFEACPYCRKVRETLTELDLDYVAHPVAHGSPRREELVRRAGKMQVPYLIDPNTDTELYESADIIAYLNATYGGGNEAGWLIPLPGIVDTANSALAGALRFGRGGRCRVQSPRRGLKRLTLYNMEGSPYCRKVREALSELDLEYLVRNLPKGSPKRPELAERGGKIQVPYLVDPNADREMYESDAIVAHLEARYGEASPAGAARHGTDHPKPRRAAAPK